MLDTSSARAAQLPEMAGVGIYGENREHAMAIGLTQMSTTQIRETNKGMGIENLHYLNDGLWKTPLLD